MKILKYLFLLLLLSLVALSIYVATQKGVFIVERSKIIKSPRHSVYSYVNDLKNWGDWNSIAVEDSLIRIKNSQNSIGNGSTCSWEGDQGVGSLETITAREDQSIIQKLNFNDNLADVTMLFKDTIGGTKITWKAKGEMSFLYKIQYVFNGGAQKIIGELFEKSLYNLDQKLDYEINTFAIKQDGLSDRLETNYLAQTFTCEFAKVVKNTEIVVTKITNFCLENNIAMNGKPFIIYHTYDKVNELTKISICIPIKEPIFISEGSDIISKKLKAFQAVKTTLTGDYSHINKAFDKTKSYINANNITVDPEFSHVEVLSKSKREVKTPSKWVTEIYNPIISKTIAKPIIKTVVDTIPKASINKTITPVKTISAVKTIPVAKITTVVKTDPTAKNATVIKPKPVVKSTLEVIKKQEPKAVTPIKKDPPANTTKEIPSEF